MHVKFSSRLTKLFIATGIFFLLILFTLTLSDYLSRGWMTAGSAKVTIRHETHEGRETREKDGTHERDQGRGERLRS
jgi:hypothetical protein